MSESLKERIGRCLSNVLESKNKKMSERKERRSVVTRMSLQRREREREEEAGKSGRGGSF